MTSLAGPGLSIDEGLLRAAVAEATNLGDGDGVFADVEDGVLGFRSLEAGRNVSLSTSDSEITINASSSSSSSGESNTASNVGTGSGWFKQKNGTDLEFRTLTTQGALTATQNTDTVSIDGPWADADADGLLEPRSGTGFNGIDLSGAASPQVVTPWVGTTSATAFEAFVDGTRVAHFGTEETDLDGNTAAGNVSFGQHTQIGAGAVGAVVAGGGARPAATRTSSTTTTRRSVAASATRPGRATATPARRCTRRSAAGDGTPRAPMPRRWAAGEATPPAACSRRSAAGTTTP